MLLFKQLELAFEHCSRPALPRRLVSAPYGDGSRSILPGPAQHGDPATAGPWLQRPRRDSMLENKAREILSAVGAAKLAAVARVEWSSRLRTCAGRADFREKLVLLNPRLSEHGAAEIDRTLRHELAHLLAQFRAGRQKISPHGREWRDACRDLAIADEKRCHNLPFPTQKRRRRFLYKCPNCLQDFPRVRRLKRAIACLACCRKHSRGKFDPRFRLRPVAWASSPCSIGKMPMPR
jgi:SprT protein